MRTTFQSSSKQISRRRNNDYPNWHGTVRRAGKLVNNSLCPRDASVIGETINYAVTVQTAQRSPAVKVARLIAHHTRLRVLPGAARAKVEECCELLSADPAYSNQQ